MSDEQDDKYQKAVDKAAAMTAEERGKQALKFLNKYASTIGDMHYTNDVWAFLEGHEIAEHEAKKKAGKVKK